MSTDITRRALVIGLGSDTASILTTITEHFKAEEKSSSLRCLWLRPYTADKPSEIECYDLELNRYDLGKLYYETDVRTWSGPNWGNWGDALASTRMLGKLAAYHHLNGLYHYITNIANQLTDTDGRRLNFYLIAPLHDPFASGAVFDVAYLLHSMALNRGGSTYGILMLPGMENDPITAQDTENNTQLRGAICYAALRELHFFSGTTTYFDSYHDDLPFSFNNMSPFQTGDCYLIGGEQKSLDYDRMRENCAWWIYLQTCTPMIDAIVTSDRNRSVFSAFGIAETPSSETSAEVVRGIALHVAQELLNEDMRAVATSFLQPYLFSRFVDETRRDVDTEVNESDEFRSLSWLQKADSRYENRITQLWRFEDALSERANVQQGRAEAEIKEHIENLVKQNGMTLPQLERILSQNQLILDDAYQNSELQRENIEKQAYLVAEKGKHSRTSYRYAETLAGSLQVLLVFIVGVLVVVEIALLVIGQLFLGLVAVVLLLIPFWVASSYQRQTLNDTQMSFNTHQRQLLNLQYQLVTQRTISVYLFNLLGYFKMLYQPQRHEILRERLFLAAQSLRAEQAVVPEQHYDIHKVQQHILTRLWNGNDNDLKDQLQDAVREYEVLNQNISEDLLLYQKINQLKPQSIPMLSLNLGRIDQQDRDQTATLVGLYHWNAVSATNSFDTTLIHLDGSPAHHSRWMVVSTLRTNIPVRALTTIEVWHLAYEQSCHYISFDELFIYRAILHPTRLGIATPNLNSPLTSSFAPLPMILVVLLRLYQKYTLIEGLCQNLDVRYIDSEHINYDELCGGLQDHPEIVTEWMERVSGLAVKDPIPVIEQAFARRKGGQPRHSERYADWEVWTETQLRQNIHIEHHREFLTGLAQFCLWLERASNG